MKDWYLEDPTRLEGTPKFTIANYVAENGFLVPRRARHYLKARHDAKKGKFGLMARSEHVQDYDGASGLVSSFKNILKWDAKTEEEMAKHLKIRIGGEGKTFCREMGMDYSQFVQGISFTYWEYIPGFRRTIVADSGVKGVHHVTAYLPNGSPGNNMKYWKVENGSINFKLGTIDVPEIEANLLEFINWYEQIRNLPRFDSDNCPVVEAVTRVGKKGVENYFVQYMRTRDFAGSDFTLDLSSANGGIVPFLVRGVTPKEGIELKLVKAWGKEYETRGRAVITGGHLDEDLEAIAMRAKAYLGNEVKLGDMAANHSPRSLMFKPELSLFFEQRGENKVPIDFEGEIPIRIISDGRNAVLQML